jgi:hypothetical protein
MWACDRCRAPAVVVEPGWEEVRAELGFMLRRGQWPRYFCMECWKQRFWRPDPEPRKKKPRLGGGA